MRVMPYVYALAALCAGLLALTLIGPARGQSSCGTPSRVIVGPRYVAPVYHAPAPVVVVKEKPVVVVEKAVAVFPRFVAVVPLADFPSYSAAYAPAPVAVPVPVPVVPLQQQQQSGEGKLILDELRRLGSRLDRLEQQGQGQGAPVPPPPVPQIQPGPQQQQQAPKNDAAPALAPQQGQPQQGQQLTALSVVQNKCAACHSTQTAKEKGAGLILTDGSTLATLPARQANRVIGRSYAGTMPPKDSGVPALSDSEVAALVSQYGR